ncbi:aminotransferase class I/II-fold pyridoxal phosphate-dependent enzyme [Parabacteroides sp. PF5-9]|uniref:aminotransferase class I/II-fold pyridoxal phosphate-dependent enzyme n=1 Tax=Parabacteroides sp. PF5-9 TaxID=1742404 RepID=UPI002474B01F|nr:aminotransferase class I/II-fold pyridoxal phosphate-dependent enzyme [Parabacteroides sp. PF5-9]MDH6357669.1 threonine-phosphate decarboxylase [Parabacteroides sp. PF5-9]
MLFGHGDDHYNTQHIIKINFSSNVWYGANHDRLKKHLFDNFTQLRRYPEPDAGSLKKIIADQSGIQENNVVITNGSITAFYLLAQVWTAAKSAIAYPSFAEYEDACKRFGHEISYFPIKEKFNKLICQEKQLYWICNPNNPDGTLHTRSELLELITTYPKTIFIIDQSYLSFTTEKLLKPADIHNHPNLILVHSISKTQNVPGLRIGYIIGASEFITQINQYIIPWSLNTFAIEAARYILLNPHQFILPVDRWKKETTEFLSALASIDNLEVFPTATTFFLVRLKKGNAHELKNYLLANHGILIRDASNFRGLDASYIRLSTQTPKENSELVDAIRQWEQTIAQ